MAKIVSVSNQGREHVCSVCQKTFREMTISSCFHTFCLDCLRGQVSSVGGSSYRCPICKVPVNFPGEVIGDLTNDYSEADDDVFVDVTSQTCDICSDGRLAINRCMQCEESLCRTCTNAHLKMKASRYHKQHVVPLMNKSSASDPERSKSQNNCSRHRNEEIQFICKKCDMLLCLVCKLLEHEHHVTKPISEEANDVRVRLSSLLQKQVSLGETLQMKIRDSETIKTKGPLELKHQLTKLNYQTNQIHAEIENEKQKAEQELKLHYGEIASKYEADTDSLYRDYDLYRTSNTEALQLINNSNDVSVVGKGKLIYDRLNKVEATIGNTPETDQRPNIPSKLFQNGVIDSNQLRCMIGQVVGETQSMLSLRHTSSPVRELSIRDPSSTSFKSCSKLVVPYNDYTGYVYGISPVGPTKAWVTLLDHSSVLLVDTGGAVLSSTDVHETCEDVAAIFDSYCYVTCPGTKSIKRVSADGVVETILTGLPQDPHGITIVQSSETGTSQSNDLYVSFTASRSSITSQRDNQNGCVRVFSENGEDVGKIVLARSPVRIAVYPENATICLSDHNNGCVTLTDLSGQVVKAIYTGESEHETFKPLGVSFDYAGHVIVSEWNRNRVSLVSQEGIYLKTLTDDVDGPQTVAFKHGILWVGGKRGAVHVYSLT